jgi:hypothetical protein
MGNPWDKPKSDALSEWGPRYYERYKNDFTSAGLTPSLTESQFIKSLNADNMEGSYTTTYGPKLYAKAIEDYNAEARKYGKLTGIQQDVKSSKYPDSESWGDIFKLTDDLKSAIPQLQQQATQYYEDTVKPKLDVAIKNGDYLTAKEIYDNLESTNAYGYDLSPYKTKVDELKTTYEAEQEDTYTPSQDVLDVEAAVKERLANPQSVKPETVKAWTEYYNNLYSDEDKKSAARLTEQFSALGDVGSSAHLGAVADLIKSTQLGREEMGYNAATAELGQTEQSTTDSLTRLMSIGTYKDQLRLLPVQQDWEAYLQRQQNAYGLESNRLNAGYAATEAQRVRDQQERDSREALNFYNQNKPKEQAWWQPLITGGLTAAGYALGGPAVGMAMGGLSSLTGGNSSSIKTSSYNPSSLLNVKGYMSYK